MEQDELKRRSNILLLGVRGGSNQDQHLEVLLVHGKRLVHHAHAAVDVAYAAEKAPDLQFIYLVDLTCRI